MEQGLQGGWVISDHGDVLPSLFSAIAEAGARWVRIGFRLGGCYKDWTNVGCNGKTALQQYDLVVNDARNRGLNILGLINNESWPGGQSSWTANNAETAGGNGDNPYMQALSLNAAVVLAKHYSGIIDTWEVWNEPNVGGSTIYPSNFAWLLRHVYEDTRKAELTGLTFISGGITSLQDSHNAITSSSSGADYLTRTYQQGKAHAGWDTIKATYGSYPLDGIGQHIYIDGFALTSSSKISTCLADIRNAYIAFEGKDSAKKITVTEVGWATNNVSESTQANNLHIAYTQFKQTPYVNNAYWFNIQDVPEAVPPLYFGLQTSNGVHKPSFSTYQLINAPFGGNMYIEQSAKDCWNSTALIFGGTSPSYASGIATAWQALYAAGKKPGPPLTPEYGSVDWSGKSIRVQEFANTRCEWDGHPHWYPQL